MTVGAGERGQETHLLKTGAGEGHLPEFGGDYVVGLSASRDAAATGRDRGRTAA